MADQPDTSASDPGKCVAKEFPADGAAGAPGELRVVLGRRAYDEIRKHAAEVTDREICGVLLGDLAKDAQGPFLHITEIIRGEHTASQGAQVTITHETWNHFHREKDNRFPDKQYLGWYHSHPDFGVFLSAMDLFIHENFFAAPHQVALVVDPIRGEEGLFYWKAGKPERAGQFWVGREAHRYEPAPEPSGEQRSLREVEKKLDRLKGQLQELDAALRERPEAGWLQTVLLMGILLLLFFQVFMGYLKDKDLSVRLSEMSRRPALDQVRAAMLEVREDPRNGCLYLEYRLLPEQFLIEDRTDGPTGMNVRKYRLDEENSRRYLESKLTPASGSPSEGKHGAGPGTPPDRAADRPADSGGSK